MPGDYLPDDLKNLWKELGTDPFHLSADQLRAEAQRLHQGLCRRTLLGGMVGAFGAAVGLVIFLRVSDGLTRSGALLTLLGVGFALVQLRLRRAWNMPDPGQTVSLQYYRGELERQRDFHSGRWLWSRMIVFAPGPAVTMLAVARTHPEIANVLRADAAVFLVLCGIAVPVNLRLAKRFQRRLEALNAFSENVEHSNENE